jgi:hypothetical protein
VRAWRAKAHRAGKHRLIEEAETERLLTRIHDSKYTESRKLLRRFAETLQAAHRRHFTPSALQFAQRALQSLLKRDDSEEGRVT